jgi:predicted AlkP superfamily pyrophosphatase or phosphodiesterase
MRILRFLIVLVLLALAAPALAADRPTTILISIDGFRADYLDRSVTPMISRLAKDGARAAMRPSFPSKTFPNHYALVTGLRPDRNGIVENNMEDAAIPGVTFKMSNHDAVVDRRWWDQAEPIWVTAEKAGIKSATMFWPGSEADIRGVRPTYWLPFDQAMPSNARVDQVLAWMDLPSPQRPGLVTLYFDIIDGAGHVYGPDSLELNNALQVVDQAVARLVSGLRARGIAADIVIVADHGMAPVSQERRTFLDDLTPLDSFRSLSGGAFMTVYPAAGREKEVAKKIVGVHPHFTCWPKRKIPSRFHYGKNPRVAPIFCLAETGWSLTTHDYNPPAPERGQHGFDPASPQMAAVFVANGPDIRRDVRLKTFDNVSVYPLLAHLVGIKPQRNDGRLSDTQGALTR